MAKASLISSTSFNYSISLLFALFLFVSLSSSSNHLTFRDLAVSGEKARLGSMPPTCHNKCNQCQPCSAAQVPAQPSHSRVDPDKYTDLTTGNRYSNYKPIGWKCSCGGHDYNP